MFDDPYRVLGLTPDATDEEVKQAYRRLAKKYHPDMNPGDPEAAKKMNEINAAYDQIKNPPTVVSNNHEITITIVILLVSFVLVYIYLKQNNKTSENEAAQFESPFHILNLFLNQNYCH